MDQSGLKKEEWTLVEAFRRLNPEARRFVLSKARSALNPEDMTRRGYPDYGFELLPPGNALPR
ncbi:MAG: hypothetical protein LBL19_07930 [Spirochaetaceae bacterium]|jgi:hypothetical protein|nr:hypothetical protein [Spirochaetaceae bacterium]